MRKRLGICMNILLVLYIAFFFATVTSTSAHDQIKRASSFILPTGDPIDVWNSVDTWHRCSIVDVPDIPARIFADDKNMMHMIEGSTAFYKMLGDSVFNFTRSCTPSWNMTGNPDPSFFSGNEFLDSTFAFPNGTVVALIHTEFPGNRYNKCNSTAYPLCWTVTIGLAVSHDWGRKWSHVRPPPQHLVAAVPYAYDETQLGTFVFAKNIGHISLVSSLQPHQHMDGEVRSFLQNHLSRLSNTCRDPNSQHCITLALIFIANVAKDPSNIVYKDGYYYVAMWNRHQIGKQRPGICIARTRELLDPSSWRGWDGSGFSATFVSPYSLDPEAPKEPHICTVIENISPLCTAFSIVWSSYLEKFVITIGCFGELSKSFYISTSEDLIHWAPMRPFFDADMVPPRVKKMITSISYPALIDPLALSFGDRNFYTIGEEPYLFWVSLGHSPYTDGRHLWASPMRFRLDEVDQNSM